MGKNKNQFNEGREVISPKLEAASAASEIPGTRGCGKGRRARKSRSAQQRRASKSESSFEAASFGGAGSSEGKPLNMI